MSEQSSVSVFVRLEYWEAYRSAVFITARAFRKALYIWGVMLATSIATWSYAWIRPAPGREWFEMLQNSKPLYWAFVLPLIFVFVLPLLSAQKLISNERFRKGFRYVFSPAGIYVESTVGKTELQWKAILQAVETKSAFFLFPAQNIAHTLPKRSFTNTKEIGAFRDLIRTNVSKVKLGDV